MMCLIRIRPVGVRPIHLTLLFLAISCAGTASAQRRVGAGIIVGEPTGLSAKWRLDDNSAIDGAAAWSFGRKKDAVQLHLDYLRHKSDLFRVDRGRLPFYFGLGGRIVFGDRAILGGRIPIGLAYEFDGEPIDIFVELVPVLDLVPATDFTLNAAMGARIWF